MLRYVGTIVTTLMLLTMVGCGGSSHEDVMVKYIENMESMNSVLADIKDAESAKQAGPKIKELGEARAELDVQAKEMGKPTEEAFKAILEKHEERLNKAQEAFGKNFQRILLLGPDVMAELDAIFSELGNSSGPDWTQ